MYNATAISDRPCHRNTCRRTVRPRQHGTEPKFERLEHPVADPAHRFLVVDEQDRAAAHSAWKGTAKPVADRQVRPVDHERPRWCGHLTIRMRSGLPQPGRYRNRHNRTQMHGYTWHKGGRKLYPAGRRADLWRVGPCARRPPVYDDRVAEDAEVGLVLNVAQAPCAASCARATGAHERQRLSRAHWLPGRIPPGPLTSGWTCLSFAKP